MTAEEFLDKNHFHIKLDLRYDDGVMVEDIYAAMIEFAKLKVKEALKAQGKLAKKCMINNAPVPSLEFLTTAYPLTNIK